MARDPRGVKVLPVCHPKGCRSYVVVDPTTKEACVVDPLLDHLGETLRLLSEENAHLRYIVDTHSHADHLSGAAALCERSDAEVVMHPAAPSKVASVRPQDGQTLPLGDARLTFHHAPGNTEDSLVVEVPGALFTGDTLLIGTVGLRDAPGSDARAWFDTLQRIFDGRPETTILHPGHDDMGRIQTTLKAERTGNGWLREDDFEAFQARFDADDRPASGHADDVLVANREGLQRVPRDLRAVSGFVDPAHTTEAALQRERAWERTEATPAAGGTGAQPVPLIALGLVIVLGTVLGFLVHEGAHLLSALGGVGLIGMALGPQAGGRRRRKREPSLFYEGPVRKTISD